MTSSDPSPVAVYGFGRDGRSIHRYLRGRRPSTPVTVLIDGELPEALRTVLDTDPVTSALTGPEARAAVRDGAFGTIVRSPGVSIRTGPLRDVPEGTRVITSIGLALTEHRPRRVVGVTGTKGKSTTSIMVGLLLRELDLQVEVAGNIGTPVLDLVDGFRELDVLVLELSSYVLADLEQRLDVGLLLNLHPEHPEWHGGVEAYFRDKCRIVDLADVVVANGDDGRVRAVAPDDALRFRLREGRWQLGSSGILDERLVGVLAAAGVHGRHLVTDLAAALTVVDALGHDPAAALPGIRGFSALPHRLETVHEADGIVWVDDSISTIPETAIAALDVFDGAPLVLIAGGHERGQDHGALVRRILASSVRMVVALPDTGTRLAAALRDTDTEVEVVEVPTLELAVETAATALRETGGVVVLSPAAPSYGRFTDFVERGERFAALARAT